jgi:hypothetical protein
MIYVSLIFSSCYLHLFPMLIPLIEISKWFATCFTSRSKLMVKLSNIVFKLRGQSRVSYRVSIPRS